MTEKTEAIALEEQIKEIFDTVKPGEKVGDVRQKVRDAVLNVASHTVTDDGLDDYIRTHANGFCAEAFRGYRNGQIVEDPDRIKDQAIAALPIVYKRVYGA